MRVEFILVLSTEMQREDMPAVQRFIVRSD